MKSPCIGCEHEKQDKNQPACRECVRRVMYVRALGGAPPPPAWQAGTTTEDALMAEKTARTGTGNPPSAALDDIDRLIAAIAKKHGVDVETMKSARGHGDHSNARAEAVLEMRARDMKIGEIAARLGIAENTVSGILSRHRHRKPDEEKAAAAVAPAPAAPAASLTLHFDGRDDLLDRIRAIARDELRTPEDQVMYWIIGHVRRAAA